MFTKEAKSTFVKPNNTAHQVEKQPLYFSSNQLEVPHFDASCCEVNNGNGKKPPNNFVPAEWIPCFSTCVMISPGNVPLLAIYVSGFHSTPDLHCKLSMH